MGAGEGAGVFTCVGGQLQYVDVGGASVSRPPVCDGWSYAYAAIHRRIHTQNQTEGGQRITSTPIGSFEGAWANTDYLKFS